MGNASMSPACRGQRSRLTTAGLAHTTTDTASHQTPTRKTAVFAWKDRNAPTLVAKLKVGCICKKLV